MTQWLQPLPTSPHREQTADLLKGIGVLLMIQVHLVELFATEEIYHSTVGHIALFLGGPPAAPVFMAVMGYFLANTNKTLPQLLRRGVLLILGGILLNIGLNMNLLIGIYSGRFALDPYAYIFGADILPLAGLSTICIALVRVIFKQSFIAYLMLAAVVSSVGSVLPHLESAGNALVSYLLPFFGGNSWWSYFPFFPWLTYPLVGCAARLLLHRIAFPITNKPFTTGLALVFFAGLVATMQYASAITADLPSYYHHGPLFALWTSVFLGGWTLLTFFAVTSFPQSRALLYLSWLGRNVTTAYVFQWLLIGNIATEVYQTQQGTQVFMWLLLVVILTSVLMTLWQQVRKQLISAPASSS
ncbi:MAG: acyltransferase family protein [Bacteroidota bacterium]